VFLYILNIELFNSQVNVDFGFGIFNVFPFIILQLIGLLFVGFFAKINQRNEMKKIALIEKMEDKNQLLQKELEIVNLKLQGQPEATLVPSEITE
jgi:hypothetical protein